MTTTLGKTLQNLSGPVLITGHTGFKGTWMTLLLQQIGVPVIGYSLKPVKNSLYSRARLKGQIPEKFGDVRSYKKLKKFIDAHQPSVILHMAAQPLVLDSYEIPLETFDVNVMGTANLMDIAFKVKSVQVVLVVTTDKVYRNHNTGRTFVESDPLEGHDPYSASKVGAESVVRAWQQISEITGGPKVVSVRAGNVIGGGDFAKNRLIPDIIRSCISGQALIIRNPDSTRPWQHVLDPLRGYVSALEAVLSGKNLTAVNFGPQEESLSVTRVIEIASKFLDFSFVANESNQTIESVNLSLDSSQALSLLNWKPVYDQEKAVTSTIQWWAIATQNKTNVIELCKSEIGSYLEHFYGIAPK